MTYTRMLLESETEDRHDGIFFVKTACGESGSSRAAGAGAYKKGDYLLI